MEFIPRCTKVIDDLLFVNADIYGNTCWTTTYRCIHIPSLVISTQLPGGSLSLTEHAFNVLLPKCIMEPTATESIFSALTTIYSIPACPPTHPRYCFIIKRFLGQPRRVYWEVLEVEIDLSIPGPIKVFSRVSQQYTVRHPNYPLNDNDNDILLYLPSERGFQPSASIIVQFLRVGEPGKARVATLGGLDEVRFSELSVDRDAGYVIIWAAEDWPWWNRGGSFVLWLDEGEPGKMVYSRTKELISSWSREPLRRMMMGGFHFVEFLTGWFVTAWAR